MILVTGGAGYIGSHVARRLLQLGQEVLVYDNLSTGHAWAVEALGTVQPGRLRFERGDVGDAAALQRMFATHRPTAVVHLAGSLDVAESVRLPLRYYRNNVANTLALLEAMQAHGCRTIIFSSTCSTYGQPDVVPVEEDAPQRPLTPYGRSKWHIEQMLADCAESWGLGSTTLRYFNVAGASEDGLLGEHHEPEVHLIPRVLMAIRGDLPALDLCGVDYPTPDGTCIRDYLHVEDVAEAHVLMLPRTVAGLARAYNLGSGEGTSVRRIIQAAEAVTGRRCPVREAPRRLGDPARLVASARRIITEHGWTPRYTRVDDMIATAWRFQLPVSVRPG